MKSELNNKFMISQAAKMHQSTIEPLYWKVEDALTDGKQKKAEGMLLLLMYIAKYQQSKISKALKPAYLQRLKDMTSEIFDKKPANKRQKEVPILPARNSRKLPFKDENKLEDYLIENTDVLKTALKDEFYFIDRQVEVGPEYKCDIVTKNDRMFYPIELKIGQADHKVVSQIQKYCYYFYRTLRYDRYRHIQPIVLANGYDEWSINELRRDGVWIYDMSFNKSLNLKRINE